MINLVVLEGNVSRVDELKTTKSNTQILNFSFAVSQGKDKDPIWFRGAVFGKMGEKLSTVINKGSHVVVTGRLGQEKYENKEGKEVTSFSVLCDQVSVLKKKEQENINDEIPF